MALKQSYKEQKIDKIRWFYEKDNLANAIIKTLPNLLLKDLISINKTIISLKR